MEDRVYPTVKINGTAATNKAVKNGAANQPSFTATKSHLYNPNRHLYRPQPDTHLTSTFSLTISAKNPNKKLVYDYDPISISAVDSNGVEIGHGSFPSFTSDPQNVTIIRSVLSENSEVVDADSATSLRSDLKKKIGLPLKIVMDTKVVVHVGKMKGKKLGIRVTCDGIRGVVVPKGKSPSIASTADAKCEVDLRIKIWKWTF